MPRRKLPATQRRSYVVMVKLLPAEGAALARHVRARARVEHPIRTRSAIMQDALRDWLAARAGPE